MAVRRHKYGLFTGDHVMPRHARLCLANLPHHVVHRGHNRQPIFSDERDYASYLSMLVEFRADHGLRLLAWCLMPNHVHLIIDPSDEPASLSMFMKRLAGRHTQRLNESQSRTGTAWEGRFKCSPIDTDEYLLACTRYVELNPVRAGLVRRAELYAWSSARVRLGLEHKPYLDSNPAFESLGECDASRRRQYRALLGSPLEADAIEEIRKAANRNQLTGPPQFALELEQRLGRAMTARRRGRPPREAVG